MAKFGDILTTDDFSSGPTTWALWGNGSSGSLANNTYAQLPWKYVPTLPTTTDRIIAPQIGLYGVIAWISHNESTTYTVTMELLLGNSGGVTVIHRPLAPGGWSDVMGRFYTTIQRTTTVDDYFALRVSKVPAGAIASVTANLAIWRIE